jgi:hypothetical protein
MTDAYVFEVHTEEDVFVAEGREAVRAKYVFDSKALLAVENTDPTVTRWVTARNKKGDVLAFMARLNKPEFQQATIPVACYVESSC